MSSSAFSSTTPPDEPLASVNTFMAVAMTPVFLICFVPSLFIVLQHFFNYRQPFIQKFYIRILLMVPINAVICYLELFFTHKIIVFLYFFRDCYEVVVVLNFYFLLVRSSGEVPCLTRCVAHLIPRVARLMCCNLPVPSMRAMLIITRVCVFQFAIQKPFLSLLRAILVQFGDHVSSMGTIQIVMRLYGLLSMMTALWCLFFFFRVIKRAVIAIKPAQIFMWIKVAMFLNLLQEFFISLFFKSNQVHKMVVYLTNSDISDTSFEARIAAILFLFEMIYLNSFSPLVFPLRSESVVQIKEVAMYLDKKAQDHVDMSYGRSILQALKELVCFWDVKGMGCPHGISIESYSTQLFDN